MIRLLFVELTRLRWRRATILLWGAALVAPLVILGVTVWDTRPMSSSEVATASTRMLEDRKDPSYARDLRTCLRDPETYGLSPDATDSQCVRLTQPQLDWYYDRVPLDLAAQQKTSGLAVVVVLAVVLLLTGTTFAGHDWATGSISNQLLAESRRTRVWLTKAAAMLVAGLAVASVGLMTFWMALVLVAEHRGLPAEANVLLDGGRGALLASLAGLLGYAAAMLTRSTVATLVVVLGLVGMAPLVLQFGGLHGLDRFTPQQNFRAFALGGTSLDSVGGGCADGVPTSANNSIRCSTVITQSDGAAYFGLLAFGTAAASLTMFKRRDV